MAIIVLYEQFGGTKKIYRNIFQAVGVQVRKSTHTLDIAD
jgi:hypothetical protein